jgi:hypothetical protein
MSAPSSDMLRRTVSSEWIEQNSASRAGTTHNAAAPAATAPPSPPLLGLTALSEQDPGASPLYVSPFHSQQATMSAPPSDIVCSLTKQVFVDPVIASDGHTYERAAITSLCARGQQSPFDGSVLEDRFFTNVMLRRKAAEWIAQQSADIGILFHVDTVGNDVIVRSMVNTSVFQYLHSLIPNFLPLADSWWQR